MIPITAIILVFHVVSTITFAQDFPSQMVTILADNGKYLCRITEYGVDTIQAAKSVQDKYCEFKMIRLEGTEGAGLFAVFQADLSRYTRLGRDRIEAAKFTIDPYCKFKVVHFLKGQPNTAVISADNGRYWTRYILVMEIKIIILKLQKKNIQMATVGLK